MNSMQNGAAKPSVVDAFKETSFFRNNKHGTHMNLQRQWQHKPEQALAIQDSSIEERKSETQSPTLCQEGIHEGQILQEENIIFSTEAISVLQIMSGQTSWTEIVDKDKLTSVPFLL